MTAINTLLKTMAREYFPGSRFRASRGGDAVAYDTFGTLSSAFQPIKGAGDGAIAGHHAFLRAADARGHEVAPDHLFASIRDDESLGHLDRLARALHMVNYFSAFHDRSRLFFSVDARLVGAAADDHRSCFDALLASLDVPTSRVVVSLPEAALDDPVTFVRSTLTYGLRGYRVLATLRWPDLHADLAHVFLADPSYVAIDAPDLSSSGDDDLLARERLRKEVKAINARGIRTLARRVETAEQADFCRDAGFALLQGRYVAPPSLRVPGKAELEAV